MARARNLKPGFFTNEQLVECEPLARILFAGLWCLADREGRLEDRPKKIKIDLLPCDNCDTDALLQQLHERNLITRYAVDENNFIQINSFLRHQKPHLKEAPSTIPAPNKTERHQSRQVQAPSKDSANRASSLNPSSLNPSLSSKEEVPSPPEKHDFDLLVSIWNETAGQHCPKVHALSQPRRGALRSRMHDSFGGEIERWIAYCKKIQGSPFLIGENDRGWRADFDWALKPQSIARVQEGRYDRSTSAIATPARLPFQITAFDQQEILKNL